jgi:hypothetical protein
MPVSAHLGRLFASGTDLTVLPCSAKGTIGRTTTELVEQFQIPGPTSFQALPRLGEIGAPITFPGDQGMTRSVVFAASVLNNSTSAEVIEHIGRAIGRLCAVNPGIRSVELPLLGTGSGGLATEVSGKSLRRGFLDFAPPEAQLRIVVRDRGRLNVLNSIFEQLLEGTSLGKLSDPAAGQYDRSVFINCPFDAEYQPMFKAMLFAIIDCGFSPRTALDVNDASEVRINKIYSIVGSSRFGIHDISRVEFDSTSGLPRFNMPLEFGIFLGAKFLGHPDQRNKQCLVLDKEQYRYQKYISDISGQDIRPHNCDPKSLTHVVRNWLASLGSGSIPSGSIVWDHFQTFLGELKHQCERQRHKLGELTHNDLLQHMFEFRRCYTEELDIGGGCKITSPKPEDVRKAVQSVKIDEDLFLILSKGANGYSYMQAILEKPGKWLLEYQDGHLDEHFQATRLVDSDAIITSFTRYLYGEEDWRIARSWKRVPP